MSCVLISGDRLLLRTCRLVFRTRPPSFSGESLVVSMAQSRLDRTGSKMEGPYSNMEEFKLMIQLLAKRINRIETLCQEGQSCDGERDVYQRVICMETSCTDGEGSEGEGDVDTFHQCVPLCELDEMVELVSTMKAGGKEEGEESSPGTCCKNLLDIEEAKIQILFSLPAILTNLFFSLITLVSVMFAGHLGELQLAGAALANSWGNVTGFAFVVGLSGALETLCGQGFGSKSYRTLGIYLQASCIISLPFCSIISVIWLYTEPILILLHQDPEIAKSAALFLKYLIPGLFAYGLLQNILRFLQTQSVYVMPMVFSMISIVLHIAITYGLVNWTSLGFKGAPLAASVSLWISVLMLAFYVSRAKNFEHTWEGFSLESFKYIMTGLDLALPSATMECLEEGAFEIIVFMGGLMPNSTRTTSVLAMCVNTQEIGYMVTYGLSAAASTRVSNELGAGNSDQAKNAMLVTLKLSLILSFTIVLALTFGHNTWAGFFIDNSSNYAVLLEDFASMTPLLAISIVLDSLQGVFSGVARGCGWQHLAVYVNLGTFYIIGMTIAGLLGFVLKLYAKGLWTGLICGLFFQASTLLLITQLKEWTSDFQYVKASSQSSEI